MGRDAFPGARLAEFLISSFEPSWLSTPTAKKRSVVAAYLAHALERGIAQTLKKLSRKIE
jgi:hypothetical protein